MTGKTEGNASVPAGTRTRKRGEGATTMTLAISKEDKTLVKLWALKHDTTVSDLLHEWIAEHCTDGGDG